jgi:hypothetical protein
VGTFCESGSVFVSKASFAPYVVPGIASAADGGERDAASATLHLWRCWRCCRLRRRRSPLWAAVDPDHHSLRALLRIATVTAIEDKSNHGV